MMTTIISKGEPYIDDDDHGNYLNSTVNQKNRLRAALNESITELDKMIQCPNLPFISKNATSTFQGHIKKYRKLKQAPALNFSDQTI